jgi:hypothetical protein
MWPAPETKLLCSASYIIDRQKGNVCFGPMWPELEADCSPYIDSDIKNA